MSIVMMPVKCPKCHKKYISNPDVGRNLICPHCLGTGIRIDHPKKLLKGKKKE